MNTRFTYDTCVKHMIRLGFEDAIPDDLLRDIPTSNISRWKNEDEDKYKGIEINKLASEKLSTLQNIASNAKLMKANEAYFELIETFKKVVSESKELKKVFRNHKEKIVDSIQKVESVIGVKNASNLFGISSSTFYDWLVETKVKCITSYFGDCLKRKPNQATKVELDDLKFLFTNKRFKYWSISALADYSRREGIVMLCKSTIYKYVKLMGIKREKYKKPKSPVGIRAKIPHEYWHLDVTIFKLFGVKFYIYFLVDNYSRYILNWRLTKNLSGDVVKEILKESITKYEIKDTQLITDGGPENIKTNVKEFLQKKKNIIEQLIAQKDTPFSNSLVEAVNKIIKNDFLRMMNITSFKRLFRCIRFAVNYYNNLRPHGSLKSHTPSEYFHNNLLDEEKWKKDIEEARMKRLETNRRLACRACPV